MVSKVAQGLLLIGGGLVAYSVLSGEKTEDKTVPKEQAEQFWGIRDTGLGDRFLTPLGDLDIPTPQTIFNVDMSPPQVMETSAGGLTDTGGGSTSTYSYSGGGGYLTLNPDKTVAGGGDDYSKQSYEASPDANMTPYKPTLLTKKQMTSPLTSPEPSSSGNWFSDTVKTGAIAGGKTVKKTVTQPIGTVKKAFSNIFNKGGD